MTCPEELCCGERASEEKMGLNTFKVEMRAAWRNRIVIHNTKTEKNKNKKASGVYGDGGGECAEEKNTHTHIIIIIPFPFSIFHSIGTCFSRHSTQLRSMSWGLICIYHWLYYVDFCLSSCMEWISLFWATSSLPVPLPLAISSDM